MMSEVQRIIYWDSCVFLSYVNGLPDRLPTLDVLLDESAKGAIKLFTSTLTHVEVAFSASEQQQEVLDPQVEQQIDSLWADPEVVVSVDYHDGIGRVARSLMRSAVEAAWSLRPLDAIHLATAQWLCDMGQQVNEFHTYDGKLRKYAPMVGFPVLEPRTMQPRML